MKSCKRDTKFKEKLPHDNYIPRGDSGPLITKNIPQIIPFRKYTLMNISSQIFVGVNIQDSHDN